MTVADDADGGYGSASIAGFSTSASPTEVPVEELGGGASLAAGSSVPAAHWPASPAVAEFDSSAIVDAAGAVAVHGSPVESSCTTASLGTVVSLAVAACADSS